MNHLANWSASYILRFISNFLSCKGWPYRRPRRTRRASLTGSWTRWGGAGGGLQDPRLLRGGGDGERAHVMLWQSHLLKPIPDERDWTSWLAWSPWLPWGPPLHSGSSGKVLIKTFTCWVDLGHWDRCYIRYVHINVQVERPCPGQNWTSSRRARRQVPFLLLSCKNSF